MICWHRQNVSCLQIVSVRHPGDVTAMFAPDLHFFDPYPLFRVSKRGSPSKNFAPRNILGLRNPHSPRPPGGSTLLIGAAAVPERAEAGPEKEGGRGLDKAAIA